LTSGQSFLTSAGEMTWNGTPMVFAVPQYFWYSSMRALQVASRRLPVTWKLTSWPVSAGRRL
jgi:hypothetical protein